MYLRFVSVKPLVLKGLAEKLKRLLHPVLVTCLLGQKVLFQKAEILFLLKVINLSKTVMIKTSNSMGSEGREEYNAADCLSIKREATKLVVVCTCT